MSEEVSSTGTIPVTTPPVMEKVDWIAKYGKCIVLEKSDLNTLARLSDSLVKTAIDDYGKSFQFHCDGDNVVISYANQPYFLRCVIPNQSGATVEDFYVGIALLKKVLSSCGDLLVIAETKNEKTGRYVYNFEVLGNLLYMETVQSLQTDSYQFTVGDTPYDVDMSVAVTCFRDLTSVVSLSDRSSEKVVVIKGGNAYFNASFFCAQVKSPFTNNEEFVVFKVVGDMLGVFAETCASIKYGLSGKSLSIVGGNFQCMVPVGDKVDDFYTPIIPQLLNFDATVKFDTAQLFSLVSLVNGMDYLCGVVNYEFTHNTLKVAVYSKSFENKSTYEFPYLEGSTISGNMNVSTSVLKAVYSWLVNGARYALTEGGLGVNNDVCKILIRKS